MRRSPRTRTLVSLLFGMLMAAALAPDGATAQGNPLCKLPVRLCPPPTTPPASPTQPAPTTPDPRGVNPATPNPLAGLDFFVDKSRWAPQYKQYRAYRRRGQKGKAAMVGKIALQPQFKWMGRWSARAPGGAARSVRDYIDRAQRSQPGSGPQLVTLRHQGKKCGGGYSGGGAAEDARTRKWYRDFARGVGSSRVVIGYEPDSLGTIDCLARSRRMARLRLLKYGIDVLSQLPNATIQSRPAHPTRNRRCARRGSCASSACARSAASCST